MEVKKNKDRRNAVIEQMEEMKMNSPGKAAESSMT